MLEIAIITVHPSLIEAYARFGVVRSATAKGLSCVRAVNLREFAVDKHGTIDAAPYGGGDGMVMRPEPLAEAVKACSKDAEVILLTPSGRPWTAGDAVFRAKAKRPLVLVCGRFGGVDQRFIDRYVHLEVSVGEFVVSGGELPALMIADSVLRHVPGVLGNEESASCDSFGEGMEGMLEFPLYTRPPVFEGAGVPEILLSGDHKAVAAFRRRQALEKTTRLRPDLLTRLRPKP